MSRDICSSLLCALLLGSVLAAPAPAVAQNQPPHEDVGPIIAAGQDELLAEMLGRGQTLAGECVFAGGQADGRAIHVTYECAGRKVVLELQHPSRVSNPEARTAQFAITLQSGLPPDGFLAALAARVRSREDRFEWTFEPSIGFLSSAASTVALVIAAVLGSIGFLSSAASTVALVIAAVLGLLLVEVSVRRRRWLMAVEDERGRRGAIRLLLSLVLLGVAAALLLPAPPAQGPSWDDLIAPLGNGLPVARGYVLSPPHRGHQHDIIYVARRDSGADGRAAVVEVQISARGGGSGSTQTRSFRVDWTQPMPHSPMQGSDKDARAVAERMAAAIAKNDTGFASVDAVALASEPPLPLIARIVTRLNGARGALVGGAVALAVVLLVALPHGPLAVGLFLLALGLALRMPVLGLPFAFDHDVQRLFTGHLPLREIAFGMGLMDRHPPFYFFVLHFAQWFGQSEAVVRAPAVIAGALAGPAILLAAKYTRGRVTAAAALAALAVTISPELVARSREVSDIPLFALLMIAAAASLVAALRKPSPARLMSVASSHALALWTYYLAPFLLAAHAAVLAWVGRPKRRVVAAFLVGAALGAPALLIGAITFVRDSSTRDVARAFPAFTWGEHSPAQMVLEMAQIATGALGRPFLALALAAAIVGAVRRNLSVITPALGIAATVAGIALLSPIARVQSYYVTTALPLAALTLAVAPEREDRFTWTAALVLVISLSIAPMLSSTRLLYLPDADAFMPRFAAIIANRPEQRILTVAHYDKALLAYYLARAKGTPVDWDSMDEIGSQRIEPLVMVNALRSDSERVAAEQLEQRIQGGPILVMERDAFALRSISERLSKCELLLQAPTARLVRCAP